MWRVLVSSLLVAAAAAQSGFSDALRLADGYLPPEEGGKQIPNSVRCEQPKTIYRTETERITNTVVRTITQTVPQVIQKTVVITQQVPSTIVRSDVVTVTSPVVRTKVNTDFVNKEVVTTLNIPGVTRIVTEVTPSYVTDYVTDQRYVTETQRVIDTQLQYTTVVQRVTQTVTQQVPQVVYVTRTVPVPGRTIVVTQTQPKEVTSVKQYQPDPETRVQNEIVYATSVYIRQVPSPPITRDNVIVRTQIVPVTSVVTIPQVSTRVIPEVKEVVRTVTQTRYITRTDTRTITQTQTVPVTVTKTDEQYVTVPIYLTTTQTVVRTVPGPDVVRSVVRTETQVKTVRDPDQVITNYRTIENIITNIRTSTIIRPSIVTRTSTSTTTCQTGYKYDAPRNPLQF